MDVWLVKFRHMVLEVLTYFKTRRISKTEFLFIQTNLSAWDEVTRWERINVDRWIDVLFPCLGTKRKSKEIKVTICHISGKWSISCSPVHRLIYNTIFSVWKVLEGLFLWNALAFTTPSEEAGNEEKVWNN